MDIDDESPETAAPPLMSVEGAGALAEDAMEDAAAPPAQTIVDAPTLDIESVAARYVGTTKVQRLLFIARRCPGHRAEARRLCLAELKRGSNTKLYAEVAQSEGGGAEYDAQWAAATDARNAATLERLELELNTYKSNLIKESIRMAYNELGEFQTATGDLHAALKYFVRTRDYCTTSQHHTDMCVNVVQTACLVGNFAHVSNYVVKAEHQGDASNAVSRAKLTAASGLVQLENKSYAQAARRFLEVSPELGGSFAQVIAPEDVATYGAVCALAALDRDEVKAKLINAPRFKQMLDLVPRVRDLVDDFQSARYGDALKGLTTLSSELLLDTHLYDHIEYLSARIKDKCLAQYCMPYLSVDLNAMATSFGLAVTDIEDGMSRLIADGTIAARIDSHSHSLHRRVRAERGRTHRKVLEMGRSHVAEMRAVLLRMSMLQHDFIVRGERGGGQSAVDEFDAVDAGYGFVGGAPGGGEMWGGAPQDGSGYGADLMSD